MNRETLVITLSNLEEVDMLFESCKNLAHSVDYKDYKIEYVKLDDGTTIEQYKVTVEISESATMHSAYSLGRIFQMKRWFKIHE